MKIDILTLFPEMLQSVLNTSIIGRAQSNDILDINIINIRDYSSSKHKSVDDYPFGGGKGMVMQAQPIFSALHDIHAKGNKTIYLSPKGQLFNQEKAIQLAKEDRLILLCGHYEGIDQRIIDYWVTEEISIGDYVLTGGEIPAMVVVDTVARMIPGVLSSEACYEEESIYSGLLEYPHYTRPRVYEDIEVPEILLSGNHGKIEEWRLQQSLKLTHERRNDLFRNYIKKKNKFPKNEQKIIESFLNSLDKD